MSLKVAGRVFGQIEESKAENYKMTWMKKSKKKLKHNKKCLKNEK